MKKQTAAKRVAAKAQDVDRPTVPRAVLSAIDDTIRKDFARILYRLMTAKNMNQSDLAKATFSETEDGRGYKVAKGRDLISKYLRGMTFPNNTTLDKLATALEVEPADLIPASLKALIMHDNPVNMMQPLGNGLTRIAFNQVTTNEAATKVFAILSEAEALANSILEKTFGRKGK